MSASCVEAQRTLAIQSSRTSFSKLGDVSTQTSVLGEEAASVCGRVTPLSKAAGVRWPTSPVGPCVAAPAYPWHLGFCRVNSTTRSQEESRLKAFRKIVLMFT